MEQNCFKERVWVRGSRPEEEEVFQFTMVQVRFCSYVLLNAVLYPVASLNGFASITI